MTGKVYGVLVWGGIAAVAALGGFYALNVAPDWLFAMLAYFGAASLCFALVFCLAFFLWGMVDALKNGGDKDGPSPGWFSWSYVERDGDLREALEIEVAPELKKWASESEKWLDSLHLDTGAMCIVIGAVPNGMEPEDRDEREGPFHFAYTMHPGMHPVLTVALVNAFVRQFPAMAEANGFAVAGEPVQFELEEPHGR